ncbi:MAG: hypothetical protein NC191_10490 [Muribaculaceae bacterium]|nr:hypothetical protein [Muribaculaceae bacterium]
MEKVKEFLKKYVDLNFKSTAVFIGAALLMLLGLKLCGVQEIPENSWLENTQLIALIAGICFCLNPKNNKDYKVINIFFALIIFLLAMREISYGRVFFAQIPGTNDFYHWSHYKYGYLAHIIIGLYIAGSLAWALWKKVFVKIWEVLKKTLFPFWNVVLLGAAIPLQVIAEKRFDNTLVEETLELLMYCLIAYMVFLYNKYLKDIKNKG